MSAVQLKPLSVLCHKSKNKNHDAPIKIQSSASLYRTVPRAYGNPAARQAYDCRHMCVNSPLTQKEAKRKTNVSQLCLSIILSAHAPQMQVSGSCFCRTDIQHCFDKTV
jgi:hypothetical protein